MRIVLWALLASFMVSLATPAEARRRGTTSYAVEPVKDLPDTEAFQTEEGYINLGYGYEETTAWFVPFWASELDPSQGGGYVLYAETADGISYLPADKEALEFIKAEIGEDPIGDHKFAPWKHMWGIGIVGLLLLYGLYSQFFGKKDDEAEE